MKKQPTSSSAVGQRSLMYLYRAERGDLEEAEEKMAEVSCGAGEGD